MNVTSLFGLLGALLVPAFAANRLFQWTRLPDVVVLMATGLLAGAVLGCSSSTIVLALQVVEARGREIAFLAPLAFAVILLQPDLGVRQREDKAPRSDFHPGMSAGSRVQSRGLPAPDARTLGVSIAYSFL